MPSKRNVRYRVPVVRSVSSPKCRCRFYNTTEYKVDVIWIDYVGKEVMYATLDKLQSIEMNTYTEHFWTFKKHGTRYHFAVGELKLFSPQAYYEWRGIKFNPTILHGIIHPFRITLPPIRSLRAKCITAVASMYRNIEQIKDRSACLCK